MGEGLTYPVESGAHVQNLDRVSVRLDVRCSAGFLPSRDKA